MRQLAVSIEPPELSHAAEMEPRVTGKTIRVATDVGGTFTDLVAFETDPRGGGPIIRTAKTDTTPPHYEEGVLRVMEKAGVDAASVSFLAHGTTLVINALTERSGVRVGLITTEGFRDTLEIARGNRPDFFNLHYPKPEPFVPRRRRREVGGRMSYRGEELYPVDLAPLPEILSDFAAEGVKAVAICFLHAYANPAHEQAVQSEVGRLWPDVPVIASHQVTREWREYERSSTTVLSAYVLPVAQAYLERLDSGLAERGFTGGLYVMQSNCGVDSVASVSRVPITMVESGPASGVWGAAELGRLIGEPDVIALDIGGTTAKCSLVEKSHVRIMTDYWIERSRASAGYPIMVPVVDLVEIGNGGGSIAWVDDYGKLHVGPRSAGAAPGPAAYGRGGSEATTTDANLWLGRINPDYFCGGERRADMDAAKRAIERVGARLGVDADEAARGIVRIANNKMVNALKLVSVNRGFDPRDFTLVAFGGGGAMHAVALAQEARSEQRGGAGGRFGVLGLGHDDVGPAARLLRHPARRSRPRERRRDRERLRGCGRAGSQAVRRRGIRRLAGALRTLRQIPIPEPGTQHRSATGEEPGERAAHRRNRSRIPRRVRARVHLPARRERRNGRLPSRRLGGGRQARPGEARGDGG